MTGSAPQIQLMLASMIDLVGRALSVTLQSIRAELTGHVLNRLPTVTTVY